MTDLESMFSRFAETLGVPGNQAEGTGQPFVQQLLAKFKGSPLFWLKYTGSCIAVEDFQEASASLHRMESIILDQARQNPQHRGLTAVTAAFQYWKLKSEAEMLQMVLRGDTRLQSLLIEKHKALLALPSSAILQNLKAAHREAALAREPHASEPEDWETDLETLVHIFESSGPPVDEGTALDLAVALMNCGQYQKAEEFLEKAPQLFLRREGMDKRQWYLRLLGWLISQIDQPLACITPFTSPKPRYVLPMVVWGDAYLDTMERFALPTLLASGNLPYLASVGEVRLLFFTDPVGAKRLATMPVLQKIRGLCPVDVIPFPQELLQHPEVYKLMTTMHLVSMEIAKASQAHFFFLAPDVVFADNFMRVIDQRFRQGAEVVFVPGLILDLDRLQVEQQDALGLQDAVLSLEPKQLLQLGVDYLHPFVKKTFPYRHNGRRSTVAVMLWPLAEEGYLVHGFHHTPFLISAQAMERFDGSFFLTLDGDFLGRILRSQAELERCVLITDALETNYFELSSMRRFGIPAANDMGEFSLSRLSRFGALLGPVAQWLLPQRIHFDPRGRVAGDPAFSASAAVLEDLRQGIARVERQREHLPVMGNP